MGRLGFFLLNFKFIKCKLELFNDIFKGFYIKEIVDNIFYVILLFYFLIIVYINISYSF